MAVSYRSHLWCLFGAALAVAAGCNPPRQRAAAQDVTPAASSRPIAEIEAEAAAKVARKHEGNFKPRERRAGPAELTVLHRETVRESEKLLAARRALPKISAGDVWVSLGPTNAFRQFNGGRYDTVDSGRVNDVVVDPRDANIIYAATAGGGVWKTFDGLASAPSWSPLTDALPNMTSGALAMDAANPDVLYFGAGDVFEGAGNTVTRTSNGGVDWGSPVVLHGTYPAPNSQPAYVGSIRSLRARANVVIAGTDGGLYISRDGGGTFALADLPNRNGKVLLESIWSVVDLGGVGWVVSGVTACDPQQNPAPIIDGLAPSAACPEGNLGTIWTSPDAVTWTMSTLPAGNYGRITLDAAGTDDPARVAVYGMAGALNNRSTAMILRSVDRGRIFTSAGGTLVNMNGDCPSLDIGGGQTYYNQSVIGDPASPDNVLIGGMLCGVRTVNGTNAAPQWELVSHWLPFIANGQTSRGSLAYVHADWHSGTAVKVGANTRVLAGGDGGIFATASVFRPTLAGEAVTWSHINRGLATHLFYSVASGDPTTQNPFLLYAGAQDNGTRFRTSLRSPSVFNQVIGGDGIGATVHSASSGTVYWGSVQFSRVACLATSDCTEGTSWRRVNPILNTSQEEQAERWERVRDANPYDAEPFFIRYANVETDTTGQSVLSNSVDRVFVARVNAGNLEWTPISQELTDPNLAFTNVAASRTTPGLYGAVGGTSIIPFYVTTAGNTPSTWTPSMPVTPNGDTFRLTGPSSMDFPPSGATPGQVFIGSFTGTLNDPDRNPPPDDKGRVYRTTNGGQSWTSIVGVGAGRLPNVPVYVVKYDPMDAQTIYAGTEIGVYVTSNGGTSWRRMGQGLPMVPVRDMYIAKNQEFLRVATWGRGLWEIYPSASAHRGAPGNGDYDRNQVIDWVDLAALASRVGATPATTTPPFYTWILDVADALGIDPTQLIDDEDLTGLLGKLGSRP